MVDVPTIHETKAVSFTGRLRQHEDRVPCDVAVSTAAIALLASLGAADAQQSDGSEALACDDSIATAMADIANPARYTSQWPSNAGYGPGTRPRSATIVITKDDGGRIGS